MTSRTGLTSLINKNTYELREKILNKTVIESDNKIKELIKKLSNANIDIELLKEEVKRCKAIEEDIHSKNHHKDKFNQDIQAKLQSKIHLLKKFI